MHAIPTHYRGRNYRSRLEARWAAFFHAMQWPFEYEPIDLAGYIPDFILTFPHAPLLVEVKPAIDPKELYAHTEKIDRSGWSGESLIVGAMPFALSANGNPEIGIISQINNAQTFWAEAEIIKCRKCCNPAPFSNEGSWQCRRCGESGKVFDVFEGFRSAWDHAGNIVQWKAVSA